MTYGQDLLQRLLHDLEQDLLADPRMQAGIVEIQGLFSSHYPEATFSVGLREDPVGLYLRAIVDVEDRDQIVDVFLDRLVDLQVDDGLPLYVSIGHTSERNAAILRANQQSRTTSTVASR